MSKEQVPYHREAEEATIGALLIDPDAMARVIATGLRPDDFYLERLALIFRAIMELHEHGKPGDYILVLSQLKQDGTLERVGGPSSVTELILRCPTSIYATHYAEVVVRSALQRRLILLASETAKTAYEGNGSIEDLRQAVRKLTEGTPTIEGVLR